jgi:NitT/TauT family transport system permease protein
MVFLSGDRKGLAVARLSRPFGLPNLADVIVLMLIGTLAVLIVHGVQEMDRPIALLHTQPVVLDLWRLPEYALRTTLRMFAAILCSLLFTFVTGTLAAKSRKAALVVVPALDILQSVPVLGFLTFTVAFFLNLFPGSQLGAECASIFAVFTAQAWNMAFSFYQSLRTIPGDLDEASRQFGLSPWRRFLRLELPFAMPGLIWNTMMSMSGGWFFVVASEAITVGDKTVTLPGIGSWLALAIDRRDFAAVAWAVGAMAVVIGLYDQLLFRPIVAWADKFRFEQTASQEQPQSWIYDLVRRTRVMRTVLAPIGWAGQALANLDLPKARRRPRLQGGAAKTTTTLDRLWAIGVVLLTAAISVRAATILAHTLDLKDALLAFGLGLITLIRVLLLIAIASLIWVPIGVWIGLRPVWAERIQPFAQTGRLPGQCPVPGGGGHHRGPEARPQHLAVAADGPRHPVVHPVQRHRRRQRPAHRPQGGRRDLRRPRLAVVAADRHSRDLPLFRHRRNHRFRGLLERQHRRRGGELGQHPPGGQGPRLVHRQGHGGRRSSPRRPWRRGDVPVRHRPQPHPLAAALRLRRAAPASRLIRGSPW